MINAPIRGKITKYKILKVKKSLRRNKIRIPEKKDPIIPANNPIYVFFVSLIFLNLSPIDRPTKFEAISPKIAIVIEAHIIHIILLSKNIQ